MEYPDRAVLERILEAADEGVAVVDARAEDLPIVYVNPAFESMTGYPADECLGRNARFLQGGDSGQVALQDLRAALAEGRECKVLLRNQRRNGEVLWNELRLVPLTDEEGVRWWIGLSRDVGELMTLREQLRIGDRALRDAQALAPTDRLTGLRSRAFFEDVLSREWSACMRDSRPVTLFLFDVDEFGRYNQTFGKGAGDSCLRLIAQAIKGTFRRGSDVCARLDGQRFACLAVTGGEGNVRAFAEDVCLRVRNLSLPHPRASRGRYVTVRGGVATLVPEPEHGPERLLAAADAALAAAKQAGGDCVARPPTRDAEAGAGAAEDSGSDDIR